MPHSLLISDLHLCAERRQINQQFFNFARSVAPGADALYVLGDLFEYWVGDDDLDEPLNAAVARALRAVADAGVALYFMHGNRDLLIGNRFAACCGAAIISDPMVVDLHGTRTLLMHGDTLCTDDVEYQRFRAYARDPANQAQFLAQPIGARREQMLGMRARSESRNREKSNEIMDVSTYTVERVLREQGYPRLIHGHTHRPARHEHRVDGHVCERWVLTDWYERGGYLRCDANGCEAVVLPQD